MENKKRRLVLAVIRGVLIGINIFLLTEMMKEDK